MTSTPGEDSVKTGEMATKALEYYMNSTDTAMTVWEDWFYFKKKEVLWVKCCESALYTTGKSFLKGMIQSMRQKLITTSF